METDSFNLSQDYFELFGLTEHGLPDQSALRQKYMVLQRQYHPDNFATESDALRREAVQIAAFVNEAYQTLIDPLKCAEYGLQLQGVDVESETDAKMDPMFLMEQMEWREALEDITEKDSDAFEKVSALRAEISEKLKVIADQTASQLEAKDPAQARDSIRQWQFLAKLQGEADSLEARLDDQLG